MKWAEKYYPIANWILTVPVDSPFFPDDLLKKFRKNLNDELIVTAKSGDKTHPVFSMWNLSLIKSLELSIKQGILKIDEFTKNFKTKVVNFPIIDYDPFYNINNLEDLSVAEEIHDKFSLNPGRNLIVSFVDKLYKKNIIAKPGFNRWLVPPASIAIHLCIGSVYAWSMFNPALVKTIGVVTSSGDDWSLSQVVWIFSVAIVSLGFAAAYAGKWLEKVGPRMVGFVAACCWGGGFLIGALGIFLQESGFQISLSLDSGNLILQPGLYLLYLGYGVIGGIGLGLGYVSPVSTLIRWFPDRRGMATGMAIMGFGGGAMIAKFSIDKLLAKFYKVPEYLGAADALNLITEGGRRFAEIAGSKVEVVVVGINDVQKDDCSK